MRLNNSSLYICIADQPIAPPQRQLFVDVGLTVEVLTINADTVKRGISLELYIFEIFLSNQLLEKEQPAEVEGILATL